jgi:hypothetical protein
MEQVNRVLFFVSGYHSRDIFGIKNLSNLIIQLRKKSATSLSLINPTPEFL